MVFGRIPAGRAPLSRFSLGIAVDPTRAVTPDACGGQWSDAWSGERGKSESGMQTVDRSWVKMDCAAWGDQSVKEAG